MATHGDDLEDKKSKTLDLMVTKLQRLDGEGGTTNVSQEFEPCQNSSFLVEQSMLAKPNSESELVGNSKDTTGTTTSGKMKNLFATNDSSQC